MLQSNNILSDVISGASHTDIAVKYQMSLAAVKKVVNDVFVETTESHADLRQRIGILSVLRLETLLGLVMPYAEGGIIRSTSADGVETEEPLPTDPRFVKLAVDIIKAENELFDKERQILMKTQDSESKGGIDRVDETIVTGDELYSAASEMMAQDGIIGDVYADMNSDDVLQHSMQMSPAEIKLRKEASELIPEEEGEEGNDALIQEAISRGLMGEEEDA